MIATPSFFKKHFFQTVRNMPLNLNCYFACRNQEPIPKLRIHELLTGYSFWERLRNFLHKLFCQFISWTNWVNSGKFMDNCWISCQVMADTKKVYTNFVIINLYSKIYGQLDEKIIPFCICPDGCVNFFQSQIVLPSIYNFGWCIEWWASGARKWQRDKQFMNSHLKLRHTTFGSRKKSVKRIVKTMQ